jgi:uroporphyrinogen III methyltransferase/synthase
MTGGGLAGRRVIVTRRPEQSARLAGELRTRGAMVVEVPLIEVAPPEDGAPLAAAVAAVAGYDWIVFTSANAVRAVAAGGVASDSLPRIASVGPATSEMIREAFPSHAIDREPPSDFRAEGLLAAFADAEVAGHRFLLPVSDRAREVLADGLAARGGLVDRVVAYRTVTPAEAGPVLSRALAEGVDVVTFASPSAVESFVTLAPNGGAGAPAAVIGPVTEARARAAGLEILAVAQPSTAEGLVAVLARLWS